LVFRVREERASWGSKLEPVLNAKGVAISYRLKDIEKLRVQCEKDKVNGITRTTATAEDCVEFPCSWITAIMRYAGAGPQAFSYGMEAIWTFNGKP
jgi:hypothetical protein